MRTLKILVNLMLLVFLGICATGILTLVMMMFTITVTWIWLTFPGWTGSVMLVTLCAAVAAEIYFALNDVQRQMAHSR